MNTKDLRFFRNTYGDLVLQRKEFLPIYVDLSSRDASPEILEKGWPFEWVDIPIVDHKDEK